MKKALALLLLAFAPAVYGLPIIGDSSGDDNTISSDLPQEDPVSLAFWMRQEGTNSAAAEYMVGMNDGSSVSMLRFNLAATTLVTTLGSGAGQSTGTANTSGAWTFYAVTRNGTSYKLYINGSTTAAISNTSSEAAGALASLTFMNQTLSGTTVFCGCTMTAIKFWNALLTPEQLQNEMYHYRPQTTTSLYGWWPMVYGSLANDLKDYGGVGARNLSNGGSSYAADGPPIAW